MEGGSQKLGLLATAYPRLSNAQNFFIWPKKDLTLPQRRATVGLEFNNKARGP